MPRERLHAVSLISKSGRMVIAMNNAVHILLYLLAACSAVLLLIYIINRKSSKTKDEGARLSLVIMVRNQQDVVEGLVRNFFRGNFLKRVVPEMKITVIDMSSNDETWEILTKLAKTYEYLEVIKESDKEKIFTYFD